MSRPVNPAKAASFVQQVQSLSFPLLFDGAMGTLYPLRSQKHLTSSEMACLDEPEIIENIHMDYIDAGAQAIKTNTFAVSQMLEQGDEENAGRILQAAAEIAQKAVLQKKEPSVRIFGDIGPVQQEIYADPIYVRQAQALYDSGIRYFLIETASDFRGIQALVEWKKRQPEKIFLLTSFAVGADGFTKTGKEGKELLLMADQTPGIDAMGFNCLCGPHHMYSLQKDLPSCSKPVSMMPNAGYPTIVGRQVSYEGSDEYFGGILRAMAENGIQILGGCCGTTPDHIRQTAVSLADLPAPGEANPADRQEVRFTDSHDSLYARFSRSQKVIAVELDPPKNDRISGFMENVSRLTYSGADCITLADCPIGRPRADSCLLACKIRRELGIDVLPHMTCRDRNLNATKALLLGLSMEDIHSILLVTGDPLPSELRDEVQSVFSFNSRRLAEYISSLQADTISAPFHLFGALNLNARNFDVQLRIAAEKTQVHIFVSL